MGCYNPAKIDIDLIVVVKESIEDSVKSIRSKMLQWVNNNDYSIGKAIGLTSIITEIKNLNSIIYDKKY